MPDEPHKTTGPQRAETAEKRRRARRITDILPAVRKTLQPLFHRGVTVDRLAADLGIPPVQVLEHVMREYTGAKHPGPVLVERKPVDSERRSMSVYDFKRFGGAM